MEFDPELLELAVTRRPVLAALAEEPHHRRELQDRLDISKTTCHRIIRSFDEHGLVRRTGSGYGLTTLGRVLAEQVARFEETAETASQLQPLLEQFEASDDAFDIDLFTDPAVDWTVDRSRTFTIDRGVDHVERSDVIRVLDWTPVPELYLDEIFQLIAEDQMRAESIYPKAEVRARLEDFPDLHDELIEAGAEARYWVHEDVPPWGLTIYGDSLVELRAYDQQSGAAILDATTEHPRAVDWAMTVFAEYRDQAEPVTAFDDLPDWGDYSW